MKKQKFTKRVFKGRACSLSCEPIPSHFVRQKSREIIMIQSLKDHHKPNISMIQVHSTGKFIFPCLIAVLLLLGQSCGIPALMLILTLTSTQSSFFNWSWSRMRTGPHPAMFSRPLYPSET
ncbi:MAG: hypothetical protein LAT75_00935 [Candidatus Cyclonatronum sp.]|uniref:hypothetical protein n=1 Tax=Cyclonatronum sp. TaxID=3024185 RepID=UPI0025C02C6D|nr:hypothetical protein [Cyclonatronum sp.]MCH8485397.1 hypothetical protein [Cyclonatronum sp.]